MERDDEVDEGVSVEVPDEAPEWAKKAVGRANNQAAKFRHRSHEAETRAQAAERERDEAKAEMERAGKPTEAFRIDAELYAALAELRAKEPRKQYARLRPHARLDEHGALLIETDDKGLMPVSSVIPLDVRDSMGKGGSGGRAPAPMPRAPIAGARPNKAADDPLTSQAAYSSLKGDAKRKYLEQIKEESKR
jgi:hypothetical protein